MNPKISKDLDELAMLVEEHHKTLGFDQKTTLKETISLVKKIGRHFNGCKLYISINDSIEEKTKLVRKHVEAGTQSVRKISKRTGIPVATVYRIKQNL